MRPGLLTGDDQAALEARRRAGPAPAVDFAVGDVRDWSPGPEVDVVVSNAVLQWVPGHESCFPVGPATCPPAPGSRSRCRATSTRPSHRALREVADAARWRDRPRRPAHAPAAGAVDDPAEYATLLTDAGCAGRRLGDDLRAPAAGPRSGADASGAELDGGHRAAAGPGRAGDDAPAWAASGPRSVRGSPTAYPVRDGRVYFPFRRVFFVARTPLTVHQSVPRRSDSIAPRRNRMTDLSAFIAGLPKAELHVHHVGSASPRIVAELAARHEGRPRCRPTRTRSPTTSPSATSPTSSRSTSAWST